MALRARIAFVLVAIGVLAAPALTRGLPTPDPTIAPARDAEPVVLTGDDLGAGWSVPANQTAKLPLLDFPESGQCFADESTCDTHNNYAAPEVDSQQVAPQEGTPVDRVLAYRWHPKARKFVQIPFQVDEVFTRYLDNSASGFAFYSGQDQHTTYAFDREGFRFTASDPENPCLARPPAGAPATTADPVKGLDANDELVFMAADAGPRAPETAPLPRKIEEARRVDLVDPLDPTAPEKAVYIMKASARGPDPEFDASNGYVNYTRDANADYFEKSESSYEGYGNAARGVVCNADGEVIADNERRRPRDYATVETDRYRFRYDGRWLLTNIRISPDGATYGPDLIDRWKARAFQQDPSSETPCCGYEEEDTNWGGSSTLLGERVGPVRAIRETWGADSGTNVIRRETFYRRELHQKSWLRVHPIPPLDGIYAQWDFNAGIVREFYSSSNPEQAFAIDGRNDEVFGNFDDPCNDNYEANDRSDVDNAYRDAYAAVPFLCDGFPYHQSIDLPDPSRSEFNAAYQWNLVTGPQGTIVDRYQIDKLTDLTPGGAAQSLVAVPYYRDDSCFDDGTGTDPGPRIRLRSADEPRTAATGEPRKCWRPSDGLPDGSDRFFQGSIATHGVHILAIAESDNARQTVPLTEIVADQRLVMLPGWRDGTTGEQYGRGFEHQYVRTVVDPANPPRG